MKRCYTSWSAEWKGPYSQTETIQYIKKIVLLYINWSLKYRSYWNSELSFGYNVDHTYTISISAMNLARKDRSSFWDTFSRY